ncbi:MAG: pyridoxamine 5'-phosphate oxidase family protein [Nitrospirota bacterium]|nr:pyridoxamine 5'-phosphate oxidase family protein [Nitrospirota bacterium]
MDRKKRIPSEKRSGTVSVSERLSVLNGLERHAVLATESNRRPYTSLIAYAMTPDMKGLIFATPRETSKYKNLLKNRNVSLLIDTRTETGGDYMKTEAMTLLGTAVPVRRGRKWDELSGILIKKHPELAEFIQSATTALVLVELSYCYHISSFQTVSEWRVR